MIDHDCAITLRCIAKASWEAQARCISYRYHRGKPYNHKQLLRSNWYATNSGLTSALVSPYLMILKGGKVPLELRIWRGVSRREAHSSSLHALKGSLFANRDVPRAKEVVHGQGPFHLCGRAHGDQLVLSLLSTLLLLVDKSLLPYAKGDVSSSCDDFHCLVISRPLGH